MLFSRRPRPQQDTAPTFACRYCRRDIPVYDDRPRPWCPHCGENLTTPEWDAPEVPPPAPDPKAPEVSALPREEAYYPWAVKATREPAFAPEPAAPPEAKDEAPSAPEVVLAPTPEPVVETPPAPVAPTRGLACAACGCVYQALRSLKAVPCPTCGLQGPVEAFRLRFWGHLACASVGALALLAGEYTRQARSPRVAAELVGPALAAIAVMHLLLVASGLRRDRYEDRESVRLAVVKGAVTVLTPGESSDGPDPSRPARGHWVAVIGLCLAPCWLFAPAAYQQLQGWPVNEGVEPEVVGPGDEVTVSFPDHGIVAGRGAWKARAAVEVVNAAEVGAAGALSAKPIALEASEGPKVRFRLPAGAELAGATVEARVTLTVSYPKLGPQPAGAGRPHHDAKVLIKVVRVALAPAGCGEALEQAWVVGWMATGLTYLLSAGALLAVTLARRPPGATLLPGRA